MGSDIDKSPDRRVAGCGCASSLEGDRLEVRKPREMVVDGFEALDTIQEVLSQGPSIPHSDDNML